MAYELYSILKKFNKSDTEALIEIIDPYCLKALSK